MKGVVAGGNTKGVVAGGNTKEQCSCISNVVSSKKMIGKVTQKQCEKH